MGQIALNIYDQMGMDLFPQIRAFQRRTLFDRTVFSVLSCARRLSEMSTSSIKNGDGSE
jgi:hypothetical protein